MTWAPNANFQAALTERQDAPVWAVEFEGHATVYTTGPVRGATWTYKPILIVDRLEAGGLDPLTSAIDLGELSFALVDRDGEALDLVSTEASSAPLATLAGATVTLWWGFRTLDQSDWEIAGRFRVTSISIAEYGRVDFAAGDPFPELKRPLFAGFGDAAATRVTALAQATAVGFKVYEDASVTRCWILEGHPVNILARLLLGDFATSGAIQTDFPLSAVNGAWTASDGFGIPSTFIDVDQIKAERDEYLSGYTGRLVVTRVEDGGASHLADFLRGFGFLFFRRSGKLAFRGYHLPIPDTISPQTVDADAAHDWEFQRAFDSVATKVIVRGNRVGSSSRTILEKTDDEALAALGTFETTIDSPWLWTDQDASRWAETIAARWLVRFARGHSVILARADQRKALIEPGDAVNVSHPEMPDTSTGAALEDAPCEVIASAPILRDGELELELWRYAHVSAGLVAPESQPDWSAATAAQRLRYAFISDEQGRNPDGTPGDVWL